MRLLGRRRDQGAVDYLSGMLVVEREAALAHEATRELVKAPIPSELILMGVLIVRVAGFMIYTMLGAP